MEQRGEHLPDGEEALLFFFFLAVELCREGRCDVHGEECGEFSVGVGKDARGFFLRAENERAKDFVVFEQRCDEEVVERLGEHGFGDFGQRIDFAQRDVPDLGLPECFGEEIRKDVDEFWMIGYACARVARGGIEPVFGADVHKDGGIADAERLHAFCERALDK